MDELTQYIREAFEHKNNGRLKESIDYFYKALTIDNESIEIMKELSLLYFQLNQNERAISFCEQILAKQSDDYETRFFMVILYEKLDNYEKAKENLLILLNSNVNIIDTAEELFAVLKKLDEPKKIIEIYDKNQDLFKSGLIYYFVGWAYSKINDDETSESFYKKSFETDPYNAESGSRVANLLFQKGEYEQAEKILKNLLKYSENDRIYYLLGELSYLKNDFDNAINYYTLSVKLNGNSSEYYYKLGSAYMEKGFLEKAEEEYCRAIALDSDNILYNYTLAYLYFVDKKYSLADKITDFLLTLDASNIQAISLKLNILIQSDNFSNVGKLAEQITKSKEKNEQSYYVLALYYSKMQVWNKAIDNIKRAIQLNPASCDYKFELASYLFAANDINEAKNICEEIVSINNKYIDAYILLSKIYYLFNDFERANDSINKTIKLDMNIPEIYYIKGQVLEKSGNQEKAIENYKIAISMSPRNVDYYKAVAHCYYEINDYENAAEYYKEVSSLDITDGECHYYLAKCAQEKKNYENAISHYSIARRLAPLNFQYLEGYVKTLCTINKKKQAISIIKNSIKIYDANEKTKLKELLSKI